jgi:hypothetical protein
MSALPAQTTVREQPAAVVEASRYPLRIRATIMIGSAAGLWVLVCLAGWFLYRIVA